MVQLNFEPHLKNHSLDQSLIILHKHVPLKGEYHPEETINNQSAENDSITYIILPIIIILLALFAVVFYCYKKRYFSSLSSSLTMTRLKQHRPLNDDWSIDLIEDEREQQFQEFNTYRAGNVDKSKQKLEFSPLTRDV